MCTGGAAGCCEGGLQVSGIERFVVCTGGTADCC